MTIVESTLLFAMCIIILFGGIYVGQESTCREETIQATPLLEGDFE